MIQRPQTLFLLLGASALVASLCLPWWSKEVHWQEYVYLNSQKILFYRNGIITETSTFYCTILLVLSILMTLVSIFLYKKRVLQMIIGIFNSVVITSSLSFGFYYVYKVADPLLSSGQAGFKVGFYMVVFALFCNMVANRLIRKDENEVRSMDRLR